MSLCIFAGQLKVSFVAYDLPIVFPASNIIFAFLTFPVTDIIADVYGKREAQRTVWIGFFSQLLTVVTIELCARLPCETSALEPFRMGGWFVFVGSSIAYFIAQFWDVHFFHWIKENITGEKHLWLRNNLSIFTSQLINSTIFIGFVFGIDALSQMIVGSMIIKLLAAVIDTPFVYLGRWCITSSYSYSKREFI
jgi:queuosine precursor transporter